MAKTKTVWKMVRVIRGKRYSAITKSAWGGICYNAPGQPTFAPKGTRLLAFKTKKAALAVDAHLDASEVWKAEGQDVRSEKRLYAWYAGTRNRFIAFWQKSNNVYTDMEAPESTVSCSELTLIKKVG